MANIDKKVIAPQANEVSTISKDAFTFVNRDSHTIHDEKLKTKPTTFIKDAFKRFCKNKSSVVAAIIIGVLMGMSFILPAVTPYNIKDIQASQQLINPRLFKPVQGKDSTFWNGCKEFKDVFYNPDTDALYGGPTNGPQSGFRNEAIVYMTEPYETTINQYSPYGNYGYLCVTKVDDKDHNPISVFNKNTFTYTKNDGLSFKVDFKNVETFLEAKCAKQYRFSIQYGPEKAQTTVVVRDWADYADQVSLDVSSTLDELGESVENVRLLIEAALVEEGTRKTSLFIKDIVLTSNNTALQERLDSINLVNANLAVSYNMNTDGTFPLGYWACVGVRTAYEVVVHKVARVIYDNYKHVYGNISMVVGSSKLQEYIDKGWCTYDAGTNTLEILDEKCPIVSINGVSTSGGVTQYSCTVTYYKYLGLKKIPTFIFGTDASGHDVFTKAFSCLKTSLLIATISTAICLAIGLVWGSICGYFGGAVDIIMERFTDILSGIPWIVMMTLVILLLGNNVVTFCLALVLTGWIGTAGTTRTQFYRFRDREYVLASRTLGAGHTRLIFKHILPNGLGTIVTSSVLKIPACIFSEATISYLGLGLKGIDSFGVLLSKNQNYLSTQPLLVYVPAAIISLLMISFNLFGNGLRDALNPTLKGGEN